MELEAFERCWHENVRRVTAYAERHVGRDASYDVVSNTFLTAWRKWNEVPAEALPWLIVTARGHIRNELRTQRRQRSLETRVRLLDETAYAGPEQPVYDIVERAHNLLYPNERDCPKNGVSGSTRRPAGWRGGVTDDRNTGGREPIEQ